MLKSFLKILNGYLSDKVTLFSLDTIVLMRQKIIKRRNEQTSQGKIEKGFLYIL